MGGPEVKLPSGHYPSFDKTPDRIAGFRVYDGADDGQREELSEVLNMPGGGEKPLPIYLPDMFSEPFPFNKSVITHGQMMLFNMATIDLNRDGKPDIPLDKIYPIDMAGVVKKAEKEVKKGTCAENLHVLFGAVRSFMDDWFGFSGLPQGVINQSFSYAYSLMTHDSSHLRYHIPDRLKPISEKHNYAELKLTENESGNLLTWIYTQAAWTKAMDPSKISLNAQAFVCMADQLDLFDDLARAGQYLVESAGNSQRGIIWGGVIGEKLFTPSWLVSSVISVGGLESDNGFSEHAVRLADVGAPFDLEFDLTYLADGKVKWTNVETGLSVITDLDRVPFTQTIVVMPTKVWIDEEKGLDLRVGTYAYNKVCPYMERMSNGKWLEEGKKIEFKEWCDILNNERKEITTTVVPGPKQAVIEPADEKSKKVAVMGDIYYLDDNADGIPDRPTHIKVMGTSPAAQYAVALIYLLLEGVPEGSRPKPEEFNRRFITALHKHTKGKIFPKDITPELIDKLKKEIFF